MPTIEERMRHVTAKVDRAKHHIDDLQRVLATFFATQPYQFAVRLDPVSKAPVHYMTVVQECPDEVSLIVGDAIQNLVSALDHLAYQLVACDAGDPPPKPGKIYFPISVDQPTYEATKERRLPGAQKTTIDAVDALTPYGGGNDLLWLLQRLNNLEKHRLLVTVGAAMQSLNLGAYVMASFQRDIKPDSPFFGVETPKLDVFFRPGDPQCPLKTGDIIFTGNPAAGLDDKIEVRFNLSLHEPPLVVAKEVTALLNELLTCVETVVSRLRPILR